ncbi:MAG: response regulator [Fluviicola sp.]
MSQNDLKHILIVDDEQDICLLIRNILKRKSSAQIDVAHSVTDAKQKLKGKAYDLTFFDLRLADGTGVDLLKFAEEERIHIPYKVVISAYTSSIDRSQFEQLKINDFIPKPLSSEKILDCYVAASS